MYTDVYIEIRLFYPGFCNAEMVNNLSWPETRPGSEPIVMACPGNNKRNVTRRCRDDATWSEADYSTCMSFADVPVSTFASLSIVSVLMLCVILSKQTTIEEDNVVMVLGILSSVVSGTPVDEQIEANAEIIADRLDQTAALLNREGVQLSTGDMMEVSFTNISISIKMVCLSILKGHVI